MSDKIKLLPDTVANQIAAGEVVNRPASAVKEMMENAIDAGARTVSVHFRDGGKESIRILDDGCGMSPIDARLAFDRHATSKISRVEDIYTLRTFGFRGEALASIAAVAQVELVTRQQEEELGTKIRIEGGQFMEQQAVVCAVGSQFTVKNLFYNVPARRRFLDKSTTEARHIVSEFQRVALCNPDIAFKLYNGDACLYDLQPASLKGRIVAAVGKNLVNNLLEVGTETTIVSVKGYVGSPSACKLHNKEQFLFVNGRYFKSGYFHKAVVQAYEKLIPANAQPAYFLYLTLDTDRIDVNVHPQKTEVKFSDGPAVWQIINASVREALARTGAVPMMDFEEEDRIEIPVFRSGTAVKVPSETTRPDFNPFDYPIVAGSGRKDAADRGLSYGIPGSLEGEALGMEVWDGPMMEFIEGGEAVQGELDLAAPQGFAGLLPLADGYVATTLRGALVIVDLRRAHEAMLYAHYLSMLGNDTSASQGLLFPERMTLSTDDSRMLREHLDEFSAFGFEIELLDENTVLMHGVPADFPVEEIHELIYDLLDGLRDETLTEERMRKERIAAILAAGGALASAKKLSEGEITAVLEALSLHENLCYTPSGHEVVSVIGKEEIKKRFNR